MYTSERKRALLVPGQRQLPLVLVRFEVMRNLRKIAASTNSNRYKLIPKTKPNPFRGKVPWQKVDRKNYSSPSQCLKRVNDRLSVGVGGLAEQGVVRKLHERIGKKFGYVNVDTAIQSEGRGWNLECKPFGYLFCRNVGEVFAEERVRSRLLGVPQRPLQQQVRTRNMQNHKR